MFNNLTLEQLRTIHGFLIDAIDANNKVIYELTHCDFQLLAHKSYLIKINASLVNLDYDVCLRITELNKG